MSEHSAWQPVFKQLPRDPANVNAWKNMCDPYTQQQLIYFSENKPYFKVCMHPLTVILGLNSESEHMQFCLWDYVTS